MNSTNTANKLGLRGSSSFPIIHNKNGVVERKNRSIMESVKSMIHDQDLPMYLWEEETRKTVYVHNRISHSTLGNKTPEEMFSRENPEVIHLNIFGCSIYTHIPKEKRSK